MNRSLFVWDIYAHTVWRQVTDGANLFCGYWKKTTSPPDASVKGCLFWSASVVSRAAHTIMSTTTFGFGYRSGVSYPGRWESVRMATQPHWSASGRVTSKNKLLHTSGYCFSSNWVVFCFWRKASATTASHLALITSSLTWLVWTSCSSQPYQGKKGSVESDTNSQGKTMT